MESLRLPKRTRNTVEKIAGLALEFLPMTVSATDLGAGRKVFFPIPMKQRPIAETDFIYVYVESKLSREPKETEVGFTEADVINSTGIYLFRKQGNELVVVEMYPLDTLFRDIITDTALRNRFIYKLNEMKAMIRLDDEFLELANMERLVTKNAEVKTSVTVHSKAVH